MRDQFRFILFPFVQILEVLHLSFGCFVASCAMKMNKNLWNNFGTEETWARCKPQNENFGQKPNQQTKQMHRTLDKCSCRLIFGWFRNALAKGNHLALENWKTSTAVESWINTFRRRCARGVRVVMTNISACLLSMFTLARETNQTPEWPSILGTHIWRGALGWPAVHHMMGAAHCRGTPEHCAVHKCEQEALWQTITSLCIPWNTMYVANDLVCAFATI